MISQNNVFRWVQLLHTGYKNYQNGKHSTLNEVRINQLLELGFEFKQGAPRKSTTQPIVEIPFEKRVEQLQKCQEELGHLNIDYRYDKWDNFGGWCAQISQRYKDWQEGDLAVSHIEESQFHQLSDMGFQFNIFVAARDRRPWEENFNAFLDFQKVTGHSNVPSPYKGDVRLGVWVNLQRDEYKALSAGKKSKLTQERYDKLESAGFIWEAEGRSTSKE